MEFFGVDVVNYDLDNNSKKEIKVSESENIIQNKLVSLEKFLVVSKLENIELKDLLSLGFQSTENPVVEWYSNPRFIGLGGNFGKKFFTFDIYTRYNALIDGKNKLFNKSLLKANFPISKSSVNYGNEKSSDKKKFYEFVSKLSVHSSKVYFENHHLDLFFEAFLSLKEGISTIVNEFYSNNKKDAKLIWYNGYSPNFDFSSSKNEQLNNSPDKGKPKSFLELKL